LPSAQNQVFGGCFDVAPLLHRRPLSRASCGACRGPRCGRSGGRRARWCGWATAPDRAATTGAGTL